VSGTSTIDGLTASLERMREARVPEPGLRAFADYYERLRNGDMGVLSEDEIEPVTDLPDFRELRVSDARASEALDHTIVLKLNGGLGTSMGLERAKSLLRVKGELTFLDIIVRQVLSIRASSGARLPLVLMNSYATHEDTLGALARYPELDVGIPLAFLQNQFPRLTPDDRRPVSWPANPALEWAPPGHGDLYTAILASGMLDTLLERGYRYAFVSNSDNLGATLEPRILAWFAREQLPFLMEVADRTQADRKGGHLARLHDDGLVLRESAQTPEQDIDAFRDIDHHRFFNTNNLWLNLESLAEVLRERDGVLGLPMIVNRKAVDPSDASTPAVLQLEAAMGAAIGVFGGAEAIRVPRRRFAPVKATDDLLAVRSDAYVVTGEARVELAPERDERPPIVELDPQYYKLLGQFEPRFPAGPPSLVACERLKVVGDVVFGRDVEIRGTVVIEHSDGQLRIEDGAELAG
jgi:UTP--glucose-1-phosphate uridylyltransferase